MAKLTLESFKNFFKYYKGEEHQMRAIEQFYADLESNVCAVYLDEEAEWILKYRNKVEKPEPAPEKRMADNKGTNGTHHGMPSQ